MHDGYVDLFELDAVDLFGMCKGHHRIDRGGDLGQSTFWEEDDTNE